MEKNIQKKGKKSEKSKIKCDFSFRHYKEILNLLKERNYKFCFFSEKPNQKTKKVYLRHDVDFSLEKALLLAKIENKNNVYSTFLIRLKAPFYNIFDSTYSRIIKEIIGLRHQLGLQFEGDIYDRVDLTKGAIAKVASDQLRLLRNYFDIKFDIKRVISFHRPPKFVFNHRFKGFINTYQPEFFRETKYLSDSKGKWREGCICQWLESPSPPQNLQVLTHPIWWGRKEKDPNLYLQNYLKEKFKYLDNQLYRDSELYKKKLF